MGTDYWRELIVDDQKMADNKMIATTDLDLLYATDSVEAAIEHIREKAIKPFGLKRVPRRNLPWLGEQGLLKS